MKMTLTFLVTVFALLAGCKKVVVESTWAGSPIIIDGNDADWRADAIHLKDQGLFLTVQNDADYLYLGITPTGRALRGQILKNGMTVYFDAGKGKQFGVRYPIGFDGSIFLDPKADYFQKYVDKSLAELDLLGPGEYDVYRVPVDQSVFASVRVTAGKGGLVYELKVPLIKKNEDSYGISANPVDRLKINLKVEELEMRPLGGPGGGPRGGSGLAGGPGSGGFRSPDDLGPRSLELDLEVTLAKEPQTGRAFQEEAAAS